MEQSNVNDVLLVKYLLGEVSESERSMVQQWLKESADNKKQFYELRLVWEQSRNVLISSSVNIEDAWTKFKQRITQQKKVPLPVSNGYKWMKVAAAILLLVVCGTLVWYNTAPEAATKEIAMSSTPPAAIPETEQPKQYVAAIPADTGSKTENETTVAPPPEVHTKPLKFVVTKKHIEKPDLVRSINSHSSKYICNGTPCPLQICISQSLRCVDKSASAFSTCSTLEPDESGQLSLKANDRIAKNCSLTIQEIRITRPITGETIVLDEHSSPATAQDLYNYITGQKKGNILAGVFHSDCDNEERDHILQFDNNNYGHLILQ